MVFRYRRNWTSSVGIFAYIQHCFGDMYLYFFRMCISISDSKCVVKFVSSWVICQYTCLVNVFSLTEVSESCLQGLNWSITVFLTDNPCSITQYRNITSIGRSGVPHHLICYGPAAMSWSHWIWSVWDPDVVLLTLSSGICQVRFVFYLNFDVWWNHMTLDRLVQVVMSVTYLDFIIFGMPTEYV